MRKIDGVHRPISNLASNIYLDEGFVYKGDLNLFLISLHLKIPPTVVLNLLTSWMYIYAEFNAKGENM